MSVRSGVMFGLGIMFPMFDVMFISFYVFAMLGLYSKCTVMGYVC